MIMMNAGVVKVQHLIDAFVDVAYLTDTGGTVLAYGPTPHGIHAGEVIESCVYALRLLS